MKLRREIGIFIVIGLLSTLINYAIYVWLIYESLLPELSKLLGFTSGMIFAFFGNKYFTFNDNRKSYKISFNFIMVYSIGALFDVSANEISLSVFSELSIKRELAFIIATSISATTNFLGMKFLVFNKGLK